MLKVIIADDSDLMRERLTHMLSEHQGVEIIGQAQDGVSAIRSIQEHKPDVVILDIRMPKANGIDVLHDISKRKSAPLTIVFTNYPYPQYRKKCSELGADFFFDKTTEFEKLNKTFKKLICNPQSK